MSLYIGLISGTSMDAVDAVLVSHAAHPPKVLAARTHPIPDELGRSLQALTVDRVADVAEIWRLDARIGALFAEAVTGLLQHAGVAAADVSAIGSHGQTVYHGPTDDPPVTIQLGDPNVIAERTGITTVADFRRRDMAAGGQGAPLAPAFHRAVFHEPGVARAIVNIGGIANVTVLDKSPDAPVMGFDTGPGNTLMDLWCRQHRGTAMDRDGEWASGGEILPALLESLLDDPYFPAPPPKSTGREYFNLEWAAPRIDAVSKEADPQDVQRTLLEVTAVSIARAIKEHAPATGQILVCGGGAHNPVLMQALAQNAGGIPVQPTTVAGFDPKWIEAVAFSWFARQTMDGQPSNLPSVTGARHPVVMGGIYLA